MSDVNGNTQKKKSLFPLVLLSCTLFGVVCLFWALSLFGVLGSVFQNPQALVALFTGLGFSGLLLVLALEGKLLTVLAKQLNIQRSELNLQRAELDATRAEFSKSITNNALIATVTKKNLRAQYLMFWLEREATTFTTCANDIRSCEHKIRSKNERMQLSPSGDTQTQIMQDIGQLEQRLQENMNFCTNYARLEKELDRLTKDSEGAVTAA